MNIVFIFQAPIIAAEGGAQRVTRLIGEELVRRGSGVFYLATCAGTDTGNQLFLDQNNKWNTVEYYLQLLKKLSIDIVISQEATWTALELLKQTPSDIKRISVCHIQPFPYVDFSRRIMMASFPNSLKNKLIKYTTIIHPYLFKKRMISKGRREFKEMIEVSDKIVLLSEKFYPRLLKYIPTFPMEKLVAINNPNTFNTSIEPSIIEHKENLIIFVGRLNNSIKNITGFIRMWSLFLSTHPNWNAEIVGDGDSRRHLESYVKKHQIKNISFVGNKKNVQDYYKRASFVALTSHCEGWGMALTEGMTFGCIPVCFDSYEAASEIISDGVDGIIARHFSEKDMALRISSVADSPSYRRNMALNAMQKIGKFEISTIVDEWEDLFEAL